MWATYNGSAGGDLQHHTEGQRPQVISDRSLFALFACKVWMHVSPHCPLKQEKNKLLGYLKISPFLVNGDDEFIDVSD